MAPRPQNQKRRPESARRANRIIQTRTLLLLGAFGVLIYLAGLQSIPEDVYEAAEVDGAGPFRIFWQIEMPLIMTQIRRRSSKTIRIKT